MKKWKMCVLAVVSTWMFLVGPVMAEPAAGTAASEFTYYKVGVVLQTSGGTGKEFDQQGQDFHMHGKIPNEYNIVGLQKYKYKQQYEVWLWKLIGFLEVSQEELP